MKEIDELKSALLNIWHWSRDEFDPKRLEVERALNLLDALAERLRWRKYPEEKPEERQVVERGYGGCRVFDTYYKLNAWSSPSHWRPLLPGPEPEEPEVLPCPRCGEVPIISQWESSYEWMVQCDCTRGFKTEAEAIQAANRRVGK